MKKGVLVLLVLVSLVSTLGNAFEIGIDSSVGYLVFTDPELDNLVTEENALIDELNTTLPTDITGSTTLSHFSRFTGSWYPTVGINLWFTPWLGIGSTFGHVSGVTSSVSSFSVTVPEVGNVSSSLTGKVSISAYLISPSILFRVDVGPVSATTGLLITYCQSTFLGEFNIALQGTTVNLPGNFHFNASDTVYGNSWGYGIYEKLGYNLRIISAGLILGYQSVPSNFSELNSDTVSVPNIGGWFIGFSIQKTF